MSNHGIEIQRIKGHEHPLSIAYTLYTSITKQSKDIPIFCCPSAIKAEFCIVMKHRVHTVTPPPSCKSTNHHPVTPPTFLSFRAAMTAGRRSICCASRRFFTDACCWMALFSLKFRIVFSWLFRSHVKL